MTQASICLQRNDVLYGMSGDQVSSNASVNIAHTIGYEVAHGSNTALPNGAHGSSYICVHPVERSALGSSPSDITVSFGNSLNNTTVSAGITMHVLYGGSAYWTKVLANGALRVSQGGLTYYTTVNNGGSANIKGSFDSGTVHAGGSMYVDDGGVSRRNTISGRQSVYAGGTSFFDTFVGKSALQFVFGHTHSTQLSHSSFQLVFAGGVASYAMVTSGAQQDVSGSASFTCVKDQGVQSVGSGGIAWRTALNNGRMTVFGRAEHTGVGSGGLMSIHAGIAASTTVASSGSMAVWGGLAVDTIVRNGGRQDVYGGRVRDTYLHRKGTLCVYRGGTAEAVHAYGGNVGVKSGGTLRRAVISGRGGLVVERGAIVSSLRLEGTDAVFSSDTQLRGTNYISQAVVGTVAMRLASNAALTLGGRVNAMVADLKMQNARLTVTGHRNSLYTLYTNAKSRIVYDVSGQSGLNLPMLRLTKATTQKYGSFSINVGKTQHGGRYILSKNIVQKNGKGYTVIQGRTRLGVIKLGGASITKYGSIYRLTATGKQITLTITAKAGKMLKGNARANTLKGTAHCDVFYGGKGNDKIHGNHGRDVAVYNKTHWGKDIIAKTKGGMTLLFNGLRASDVVQKASGANLVITRKGAAGQSITIQGYNAATHKIVFGSGLKAVDKYLAAARPTAGQTIAARNQIWKKAGLA